MKHMLVVTAAAVVVVANAWCLIAARCNRSEASGGTLELTEREARLVDVLWESTAILLDLRWTVRRPLENRRNSPAWLDATKLAELGFDCTVPLTSPYAKEHYRSLPSKIVFVVLEYEGESRQQTRHDREESRLFIVDAGREAGPLRNRYADTERYAISRGVVGLSYREHNSTDGTPLTTPRLQGRIWYLVPNEVFVPNPMGRRLEGLRRRGTPARELPEGEPRFAVTVSWGSDHEPWVREVRRLEVAGCTRNKANGADKTGVRY